MAARTWANIRWEVVLEASRLRLMQFQAGIMDVNIHGSGPRAGDV